MTKPRRLTPKQALFVLEYLVDFNATQAAIRAGYSEKTARKIGSENLTKPDIEKALREAITKRAEKVGIDAVQVLELIQELAEADPGEAVEWGADGVTLMESTSLSAAVRRTVAEVSETTTKDGGSVKIKFHAKTPNLQMLAKHLGLLIERHEHSGPGGEAIITRIERVVVWPEGSEERKRQEEKEHGDR